MGSDRSMESGRELTLDPVTRMKKAEMDRRQLMLRSLAFGAAGVAGVSGFSLASQSSLAQDIPQDELVTMTQEQQQVWLKNFNPLLAEGSACWPDC